MVLPVLVLAACGGGDFVPTFPTYTVGGSVAGLSGTLGLQNNGRDTLSVTVNGPFTFSTALEDGSAYSVTVSSQPTGQTCVVTGGSGPGPVTVPISNITSVAVTCTTNTYSVGGTVRGLAENGLVLADGADSVSLLPNATSFAFPTKLAYGAAYSVSVKTRPAGQTCTATNASGTVGAGDVTNINVSCSAPALASSYANKNNQGFAPVTLPGPGGDAFALADFFHDGSTALVLHTLLYSPSDPSTYHDFGHIYFYRQDANGNWVDNTAALLTNTIGCLHPRKAIIADFNNDGMPDVFFACHGADAPPYPGEQPHLLLSQIDGTYKNVTLPVTCFCHSASAADVTRDGYPDILVTDTTVAQTPYFLINNQDGTFTADYSRLPASLKGQQIFTAELIDFSVSGRYDVFLAGSEPGTSGDPTTEQGPLILPNDGLGGFISTVPLNLMQGEAYGLALDIVFTHGNIYLLKVNHAYTASEIQRIDYQSMFQSVIYSHSGAYPNGPSWVNWIVPASGLIESENAAYGVSVSQ
jgi:hypothetical protein